MSERAVLISIQPKWCEKIASREKTIEVRKSRPKLETPFKVYIYCTEKDYDKFFCVDKFMHRVFLNGKGKRKVIGEFVCDRITDISVVVRNCNEDYNHVYHNDECKGSCLTWKELQEYGNGKSLYGWHITDLKIYDKPKELSEFEKPCNFKWECSFCERYDRREHKCYKAITRPPQSWCYVEPLKEN